MAVPARPVPDLLLVQLPLPFASLQHGSATDHLAATLARS
jgi:hypothetical protein